ncbi:MAG TPA: hypothetical protein VJU86_19545 [Pyrinomonadaceae bacterium]|nr:hypothetical protein [Pyrinomonadaceae bacterium]
MRTNATLRSHILLLLFSLLVVASLGLTSCSRGTTLVIETGPPARFVLSGPGTLDHFQISGPDLDREPNRQGDGERLMLLKVYWELAPSPGNVRRLDDIGTITYGEVPNGFIQVQPSSGTPAPIVERDLYNVRVGVNNNHGINRFFAFRDGKIVAEGER